MKNNEIFNKNKLKIIITDSGLGGLSIQALLDYELRKMNISTEVELIFYNSLAHHDFGYNTILDPDKKIAIFNSAITGMLKLNPDIILIACNTLSVLYYETKISKMIKIPVIGIVDLGVELIIEKIKQYEKSKIILLGTTTTIKSNQHKRKLIANGLKGESIITQACEQLESEIQLDPKSKQVNNLIEKYIEEAFLKIHKNDEMIFIVLCCTHYSYSIDVFQKVIKNMSLDNVIILDPNKKMADVISQKFETATIKNIKIKNFVYSRVDIYNIEIEKLSELLFKFSPSLTKALKNYKWDKNLFHFENI